ncbi:hypothetical protein EV363DRAFT_1164215 [Boletus edulis]|nr:hypothetical protein EV363DRAFT_1164215 [Boletus edulis]
MQRQTRRHILLSRSVLALLERLPVCTFLRESLPMPTIHQGNHQSLIQMTTVNLDVVHCELDIWSYE